MKSKAQFTFATMVVYHDGNPFEVAYSRTPMAALEAAKLFSAPLVTCYDADDPEAGYFDCFDGRAVERWLDGLTDSEFARIVASYTGVNYFDGEYDEDGRLIRDEALDALYEAVA